MGILALTSCALLLAAQGGQGPARVPSKTGDIRAHIDFPAKALGGTRTFHVWLPPDYETQPKRRYPVLYLGDGQNVFDGAVSFIPNQEWRADEIATAMVGAKLVEPLILVAIDHGGAARADEYLPTRARMGNGSETGGRADRFAAFVIDEVKPFVDKTYRTKPDRANTGLAGSSFGGIMTLTLGVRHPDVFGKLGVFSPSVWWDRGVVVRMVDEARWVQRPRVWLDMGTAESATAVPDMLRLRDAFVRKGWREGRDLVSVVMPRAQHNEGAWADRFDLMLLHLFPMRP